MSVAHIGMSDAVPSVSWTLQQLYLSWEPPTPHNHGVCLQAGCVQELVKGARYLGGPRWPGKGSREGVEGDGVNAPAGTVYRGTYVETAGPKAALRRD